MGRSSPNFPDNFFDFGLFCFHVSNCFYKTIEKEDRQVGGCGLTNPSFSRNFLKFFQLVKTPKRSAFSKTLDFIPYDKTTQQPNK